MAGRRREVEDRGGESREQLVKEMMENYGGGRPFMTEVRG
jgi:hypothetical protein